MPNSTYSGRVFRVTNTQSKGTVVYNEEDNYYETTYAEGSLSWALQQAAEVYDEDVTIVFDAAVSGKTLILGKTYETEFKENSVTYFDITTNVNFVNEGSKDVTMRAAECEYGCCRASLTLFGNANVGSGIKLDVPIDIYSSIHLDHTEVISKITLESDATITGEGIRFTGKAPFALSLSNWDGQAASLQHALPPEGSYTMLSNSILTLNISGWAQDNVTITEAWKAAILPEGFADVCLTGLNIDNGQTITIAKGTTLLLNSAEDCTSSWDISNGTLIVEEGARLKAEDNSSGYISVNNYSDSKGTLKMNGADLSDVVIQCAGGKVELNNCKGYGIIHFDSAGDSEINITGCDLSKTEFFVMPVDEEWETTRPTINLSGNYWGTTKLSSIMKKFVTYDSETYEEVTLDKSYFVSESNPNGIINLGTLLSSAPNNSNTNTNTPVAPVAPTASVDVSKSNNKGKATVTLKWEADTRTTYTLTIDGGKTYKLGKKSSWKGSLKDGEHSYTITASRDGLSASTSDSFSFDATAPTVSAWTVDTNKDTGLTTLSWVSDADAVSFSLMKGKKPIKSVETSTCTLDLADGKYSYSLVATDSSGNKSTSKFSFVVDTTPVNLRSAKVSVKKGKTPGGGTVSLSWKGESKATYSVSIYDASGELVSSQQLTKTSLKQVLRDGTYTYTITAQDKAGNLSTLAGETPIVVDTIAPVLADFSAPANKDTVNTPPTISWTGVEGETYTLKVGKVTQTFKGAGTHSYAIAADGKYSYTLTAVDLGKNKVTQKGSFTVDTVAPDLNPAKVTAKKGKVANGMLQVTLSWKGESKATYSLVGDSTTYSGTKASSKLSLASGTYSYTLTATDKAGNASTLGISLAVDTETKSVSVTASKAGSAALALDGELAVSAGAIALTAADATALGCMGELSPTSGTEKNLASLGQLA